MKATTYLFIFAVLFFNANLILAQTDSNQEKMFEEEAIKLINKPEPTFKPFKFETPSKEAIAEQFYQSIPVKYSMKDGKNISGNQFKLRSKTTVILVHGVLSNSFPMNKSAGLIRESMKAEVITVDLRGHGNSEGTSGDVDFIDQYADDLAEIVRQIKADKPKGKIILSGHSMGGGIVLRYAMRNDFPKADGYLLFAPLLGQDTPTVPQTSSVTQSNEEPFLKIHIERIIGLKMLNSIGKHQFDDKKVLFFNVPEGSPIKSYSFRANESMSPFEYKKGLNSVDKPLLVLVGSKDEAFVATAFEKAIKENSKGEVFVIEGANHNGIRENKEALKIVKTWAKRKFASSK